MLGALSVLRTAHYGYCSVFTYGIPQFSGYSVTSRWTRAHLLNRAPCACRSNIARATCVVLDYLLPRCPLV
jgi:hypothetical protein